MIPVRSGVENYVALWAAWFTYMPVYLARTNNVYISRSCNTSHIILFMKYIMYM
jgi:hypothetical protein